MDYTDSLSQIGWKRFWEAAIGTPNRNVNLVQLILAAMLFAAAFGYARLAAAEQRVALVIGNSAYPSAPLRNPVNDANAMAVKLRALGFEVMLRTNATQKDINRAVVQFGQKLAAGSVGLFYYAGHGLQVRGKNFLVPVDAEIENEASVRSESVDVDQVLDQFVSSRLSMVILDACRNNPFERRFRAGQGGGLAQIDAPKGTLIAYSTAPGKTAADGSGFNGVYTEQLLKTLDTPGLKVEDVFKQVRINVARLTQDQQIPWEASSLTGEFFFRAPIERPVLAAPASNIDPAAFEMTFWDSIKTSTNRADFESYLEQYPKGRFAPLARNRVKALDQDPIVAASRTASIAQSERERAELLKAMEVERKKRDRDAEAVKQEMEKLRAELLKLTVSSVATRPPIQAAPPSSAISAGTLSKPAGSPSEQPAQLALAPPTLGPGATTSAPFAAEWAPRIALLENLRGKLTFSKALAILLDINSENDLTLLLAREVEIRRMRWNSAYAMGANSGGNLIIGGGIGWNRPTDATETAVEQCAGSAGSSLCKVVVLNGDFREKEFREMAVQLEKQPVSIIRQQYLQDLSAPLPTPPAPVGGRSPNVNAFGFSSARK